LLLDNTITARRIAEIVGAGATVRVTQSPTHPRSGWLTMCRVDDAGTVTFDQDPTTAADSDWLVQLGPGLSGQESR
jgi:hypothetical protein